MFNINCNNLFLKKKIIEALNQKFNLFIENNDQNSIGNIDILINNSSLIFSMQEKKIKMQLPFYFDSFHKNLTRMLSSFEVKIGDISYIPTNYHLFYNDKNLRLTNIQNMILNYMLMNLEKGMPKYSLYKKLWPNDKEISINKLDTHLTNLKNDFENKFNKNLNLVSSKGQIRLIIY